MKLLVSIQTQALRFYTFVILRNTLKAGLKLMDAALQESVANLLREVSEIKDAKDSVIVLLRRLKDILDAGVGGDNSDAVTALNEASALLDSYQSEIAQAVVENTPADPVPANLKVPGEDPGAVVGKKAAGMSNTDNS